MKISVFLNFTSKVYLTFETLNKQEKPMRNMDKIYNRYIKHINSEILSLNKNTLLLACMYVCYKKNPKSIIKFYKELNTLDTSVLKDFKLYIKLALKDF